MSADAARSLGTATAAKSRWFSPQPSVTGRGILARYSPRFWLIVVLLGLVTALCIRQ